MTTKILALTDALGNLVRFVLMPGHRFDTVGFAPLIEDIDMRLTTILPPNPRSRWRVDRRADGGLVLQRRSR